MPCCATLRRPWTRVLLLQQLLVELVDLLDPDCVRQPLARRVRLAPVAWAKLPGLTAYQQRLQVCWHVWVSGRLTVVRGGRDGGG